MPSRPPTEKSRKAEASELPEHKTTRLNFEALGKKLFAITPAEYAAEEARQSARKGKPNSS